MKPSYNRVNRQTAAKVRQERYSKLTIQQKLEVLTQTVGPDKANRQRNRLMGLLAKQNLAVVAKAEKRAEKKK